MERIKQVLFKPINWLLMIRFFIYRISGLTSNYASLKEKEGWELTFYDDFRNGLNRDVWRTDAYFGLRYHPGPIVSNSKPPAQFYDDNCVKSTSNGLELYTKRESCQIYHIDWSGREYGFYTIPYKVGQIDSSNGFQQKHGYFEIRSKQPNSGSQWTAFWLASKYAWPPEIDIYEIWTSQRNGKRSTNTIHWSESSDPHKQYGYGFWTPNLSDDYHVWGCEWDEKWIKIYFDGIMVNIYPTPSSFIHPMHIIINNGIDHNGGNGVPKDKDMKSDITTKYVDYVKSYKKI